MVAEQVSPFHLGEDRRRRISLGAVLAAAMGAASFPGFAFGALGPFLVDDFQLSRSRLGLLTTLFFAAGGFLSLVAGPMVDRFGGRKVMLGAFGIITGALLAMAGAPSFLILLAAAAFGGLSLATVNPTTNKLVAVHVPPGKRGVIMGVKQSGVQIGAFAAGAVLAPLAAWLGWRTALMLTAVVPLLGALGTLLVVPRDHVERPAEAGPRGGPPTRRAVGWLTAYAFLMGSGVSAVTAYLPLYSVERLDFSVQAAGAVAALIGLVGIVGRIVWGFVSERRKDYVTPLMVMALGAIASVLLMMWAEGASPLLLWTGALLLGATAVTWNSVGMLAVIAATGPRAAGRASGYVLFGFYGGFVGSPIGFGWLVDSTGRYDLAWTIIAGVFLAASVVIGAWQRTASSPMDVRA